MSGASLQDLSPHGRQLVDESMAWMDDSWDIAARMLSIHRNAPTGKRDVRSTARYALGLLLRNAPGDTERACHALDAVLDQQYDEPGSALHGAFRGWPGQPHPGPTPTIFQFDPNHRQFNGTLFAVVLDEYESRLPANLTARIDRAILHMVEGEPPGRCLPVYSNIALMQAGLLTWAGARYGRADWTGQGEALACEVHRLFGEYGAFEEYNSPTYYGTDLFALAFWKRCTRSGKLSRLAADIEAAVWQDTARFYHAGLKNLCGPFTRSYGMEMTSYCALLGMCIWLGVGRQHAPFPPASSGGFDHCWDFCWGPCLALLNPAIPPTVLPHLVRFSGERLVEKRISAKPDRVATAWLSDMLMIGAESTPLDGGESTFYRLREDFEEFNPASHHWQDPLAAAARCSMLSRDFCPATVHWQQPDGRIGWLRLQHLGAISARAAAGKLSIAGRIEPRLASRYREAHTTFVFRIGVPEQGVAIDCDCWRLPGLTLRVESNLGTPRICMDQHEVVVTYVLATPRPEIRFEVKATADG